MTIVTRRTLLIPYTESFELDFLMLNCCAKNRAYMNGPKTVSASRELFKRVLNDSSIYAMAVLDNYNREFMGHVFIERDDIKAELGFIFDKLYWKQGLASEALKAFFPKACERLGLMRVVANAEIQNCSAIKILQALEFQNKGENEEHFAPSYDFEWIRPSDAVVS
ncbi:GNAT family N-acetyltransferase [Vibrio diazotrophicus]|uniref:GNAT family N-acetyltransferase n=1 Tax=Vibrio diazotrophicus TaxID=685 RepID=UPI00142E8D3C|nr:GNAT family N-acetyltransferase [Vibrio diazotrophicus]